LLRKRKDSATIIAVIMIATTDSSSIGFVVDVYKPGPELNPLLRTLVERDHHILEEN